jgi:cytidylate kinase
MKMVIGIYGKSCVGKTSVAKALGRKLGIAVRHCGELAKERASKLRIDVDRLPENEHVRLDNETRKQAKCCKGIQIIEGRYLDSVLLDIPNVVLWRLVCSKKERVRRSMMRNGIRSRLEHRQSKRPFDRKVLPRSRKKHQMTINTVGLSISQVANLILKYIEGIAP